MNDKAAEARSRKEEVGRKRGTGSLWELSRFVVVVVVVEFIRGFLPAISISAFNQKYYRVTTPYRPKR